MGRKRVMDQFLTRLDKAVSPKYGRKGVNHIFFGGAVWGPTIRGCVASPGAVKLSKAVEDHYKQWDPGKGFWESRVVYVWEYGTSRRCCRCGSRMKDGSARKPRRTKGAPPGTEPTPGSRVSLEWRRHRRWRTRPAGYELITRRVRGVKGCQSIHCRLQHSRNKVVSRFRNRDGTGAWNIGRAGRAQLEGRERPAQLRPRPRGQQPQTAPLPVVAAED